MSRNPGEELPPITKEIDGAVLLPVSARHRGRADAPGPQPGGGRARHEGGTNPAPRCRRQLLDSFRRLGEREPGID